MGERERERETALELYVTVFCSTGSSRSLSAGLSLIST